MSMLKFSSLTKTHIEVELEAKTGFRVGKIGPSKVKENYRDNCIIGPVFSTIFWGRLSSQFERKNKIWENVFAMKIYRRQKFDF